VDNPADEIHEAVERDALLASLAATTAERDELGNELARERAKPGGAFDAAASTQLQEELSRTYEHLRDFNHVAGEPLDDVAAVAAQAFAFAQHRSEAAEAALGKAEKALLAANQHNETLTEIARTAVALYEHDIVCRDFRCLQRDGCAERIELMERHNNSVNNYVEALLGADR